MIAFARSLNRFRYPRSKNGLRSVSPAGKRIETEEDDDDDGKYSYGETDIYFDYTGKIEYGYEKNITVSLFNDRSGYINAEGLTPEEWNDILNYFKNAGGYTLMEM